MKKQIVFVSVLFLAASTMFCDKLVGKQPGDVKIETAEQKFSYAIGLDIGSTLKDMPTKLDIDAIAKGMRDTLEGKTLLLTPAQVDSIKNDFYKKMQEEQTKKAEAAGEKNKVDGEAFLAANKTKDGVKTTASGLQYKVITEGKGAKPKAEEVVTVNYRGTLIDGTEFDNSYTRGQPATFTLGQVIPGWTEALQLMSVGSKYQVFIPSDLGYGPRGAGKQIGPNATLIFDVELLSIQKAEKAAAK
jgi:FKBP-type peptidyl-prolyl cis-trans isomerase FkpA